jgi:hypothetical protein
VARDRGEAGRRSLARHRSRAPAAASFLGADPRRQSPPPSSAQIRRHLGGGRRGAGGDGVDAAAPSIRVLNLGSTSYVAASTASSIFASLLRLRPPPARSQSRREHNCQRCCAKGGETAGELLFCSMGSCCISVKFADGRRHPAGDSLTTPWFVPLHLRKGRKGDSVAAGGDGGLPTFNGPTVSGSLGRVGDCCSPAGRCGR